MPADLFRSAPPSRRRTSLIPLSIAIHAAVICAVVISPLLADADLPPVTATPTAYVEVKMPTLPPAPRHAQARHVPATATPANPNAAPLIAPDRIAPEPSAAGRGVITGIEPEGGVEIDGGVPGAEVGDYVPPAPPTKPYRVGGDVRAPTKIKDVMPRYPVIAQQAHIEGTVIIEAVIGADGRVQQARALRPAPFLEDAALAAVRQWVFTPTRLNGEPVPVVMTVTVTFNLH